MTDACDIICRRYSGLTVKYVGIMIVLLLKSARALHTVCRWMYEELFEALLCPLCRLHKTKHSYLAHKQY